MTQINCLKCKQPIDSSLEACPNCGEKVTSFQRTYSVRLIDGKYQILDRLGVGGMGEIFKVRHIHLNELRVIKIMRPNVAADDQGLQRFLQEARTSTMIKHRNLAMLYDFAQLDDGSYYMVWEFIDGVNIQKWIASNGPVPPRLSIEIAVQALNGLEHLHSMGLIHRDISPENIMLSQDHHGKLLVKVIDFGIAKSLAEGEGSGQGLTQTGMFLGKLKYASPEQAGYLKEGEHLDPRSDLYSFGILMYEMLAGRAPFQATNPHGYILKHVTEKPAPIAETNPEVRVPSALESVVMRSLEKNRENRYKAAVDFVSALEAIRASIPPDQKYGVGERMVTLSAAKTLQELPKYTGPVGTMTGQPTQQMTGGQQTQQTSVSSAQNEATVMERGVAPQRPAVGSNEATVLERISTQGGAPTALEAKFGGSSAEPTVLERQIAPPRKKSIAIGAVAAAMVIAVAIVAYLMTRPKPDQGGPEPVVVDGGTSGTEINAKAGEKQGKLLLSASPWGELEKIVNLDSRKPIDLDDEKKSTPTAILLDPGKYAITVRGPDSTQTIDVRIQAGQDVRKTVVTAPVNYEDLEKEVKQP